MDTKRYLGLPPNWYGDEADPQVIRYWDGGQITGEMHSDGSGWIEWWQASDGAFYPPELHPNATAPSEPRSEGIVRGDDTAKLGTWISGSTDADGPKAPPITRRRGVLVPCLALGLALAIVVSLVVAGGSSGHPQPPQSVHANTGSPPSASSTAAPAPSAQMTDWLVTHGDPVATATQVATSLWTARNKALVAGDGHTLTPLDAGDALRLDAFHLFMVACGCQASYRVDSITALRVVIPQQTAYPLDFLAAFQTSHSQSPELMVLTKASASTPVGRLRY
jgi:hypothetical protein